MTLSLILAGSLILVNAFYVAAEFATVAARLTQIQKLAHEGNELAGRLLKVIEKPKDLDQYIATCQIGITFSSLVNGACSEANLGPPLSAKLVELFHLTELQAVSVAAVLILSALTLCQILFGELLPKAVALQYSNRVAMFMYWPLHFSSRLFQPFIWLLNGSGTALLSLLGVPASSHKHIHSLDEIELLLAQSKDGGLLEPEEHERLHHALELSQETAKQIMTPRTRLTTIGIDASLEESFEMALSSPFTRLLVYGDSIDDVRGFVNVKDIVFAKTKKARSNWQDGIKPLVKPIPIVPHNLTMDRLLKELRENHSYAAVVMDEHGGTLGIVTVGDILGELIEETELDAFQNESPVAVLDGGDVCLSGAFKLKRASKYLGAIPDTEADTINGLIIETLGRVPIEGETMELDDVTITVREVEHNAVTSLVVSKKEKGE